jgi:hypothetical protein
MKNDRNRNCVIIPIYNAYLDEEVMRGLNHNLSMVTEDWEPFFIAPKGLETAFYEKHYPAIKIKKFDQWNGTVEEYNHLLMSDVFYSFFQKYEYLLIMHTDALVLKSFRELRIFTEKNWGVYRCAMVD